MLCPGKSTFSYFNICSILKVKKTTSDNFQDGSNVLFPFQQSHCLHAVQPGPEDCCGFSADGRNSHAEAA